MMQKCMCLQVQSKRLIELLRLEGISGGDCLVQTPAQSRISKGWLLRAGSGWVLSMSKDGDLSQQPAPVLSHPHS